MNLFEAGALLTHNTGKDDSETGLSLAREKEIAVLVNRPLNAIPGKGGGMIRLADPQAEISNTNFEAQQPKVAALEHDYKQVLGPNIPQPDKGASPLGIFQLGRGTQTGPGVCPKLRTLGSNRIANNRAPCESGLPTAHATFHRHGKKKRKYGNPGEINMFQNLSHS